MNDITAQEAATLVPSPPIIAKAGMSPGGVIGALVPQSLDDAFRLAKALSMSGDMVPKHFQGKQEMIMAAIVRGMEIGLAPMQALSNIAVINGRASIWGDALPALIQKAGHDIDSGIEGEGDQMVAWAEVTRNTGKVYRRTFSVAEAKKAGLWGKAGPWQSYPTRMLQMRARSYAARDGASDALMGLQVAEEMQDVAAPRDVTPRDPGTPNLAQRLARPPAAPNSPPESNVTLDGEIVAPAEEATPTAPDEAAGDDGIPGSAAWDQGMAAFKAGQPVLSLPFDMGTQDAADWLGGYIGARRAAE